MKLPDGFSAGAGACGIKPDGLDLGLIVCDEPSDWAGVFTLNAAAAAPVKWCRATKGRRVRALVVNSGNANACTGAAGEKDVWRSASGAASALGCVPEEVLVASTGPIGVPLPVQLIEAAIPELVDDRDDDADPFARSILTTDTVTKVAEAKVGSARVVGIAKGAAMIAPNMATTLAFLMTDADADAESLQSLISEAVNRSFNRISVDACESTNDSVFLLASGRQSCELEDLQAAVSQVCAELAEMIVRDAEGASRFIRIEVSGAPNDDVATNLGRAVAASDLWRAAAGGNDPNWGRILSALGAKDRSLELGKMSVEIGGELLFDAGSPCGDGSKALEAMTEPEFDVRCVVGDGPGTSEILTCDLTSDYVKLNAEGTT